MEVLAAIHGFLCLVALRLSIESLVAGDWDEPEYVEVAKYQHEPMKEVFAFLLRGDQNS